MVEGEGDAGAEAEGEGEGSVTLPHWTLTRDTGATVLLLLTMKPNTWLWPTGMPPTCRRQSGRR